MTATCEATANAFRLRYGSSIARRWQFPSAHVCAYKRTFRLSCIGQAMNGCTVAIHDRPPQASISSLSTSHCLKRKQRSGSPSCGSMRNGGKAKTTKSSYVDDIWRPRRITRLFDSHARFDRHPRPQQMLGILTFLEDDLHWESLHYLYVIAC